MLALARLLWVLAGATESFHHWLTFRLRVGPLLPLIAAADADVAATLEQRLDDLGRRHLAAEGCAVLFPTAPPPTPLAEAVSPVDLAEEA